MNEIDRTFIEISQIIENARENAYRKVNEELILMYQKVGSSFLKNRKRPVMVTGTSMPLLHIFRNSSPALRVSIVVDFIA